MLLRVVRSRPSSHLRWLMLTRILPSCPASCCSKSKACNCFPVRTPRCCRRCPCGSLRAYLPERVAWGHCPSSHGYHSQVASQVGPSQRPIQVHRSPSLVQVAGPPLFAGALETLVPMVHPSTGIRSHLPGSCCCVRLFGLWLPARLSLVSYLHGLGLRTYCLS